MTPRCSRKDTFHYSSFQWTFPLEIPSPEPDAESSASAGPPPFEHGLTELPPTRAEITLAHDHHDASLTRTSMAPSLTHHSVVLYHRR